MNRAQTAFEKAYKEDQNNLRRSDENIQGNSRLNHLLHLKKTNPDHLKQTVTCEEIKSFKKAKAYSEWKKYQIKRASTIFAGLVIAMLLLGFNYGNIVTPENGLGLVIPFIIITLLLFSLFYIYILAIWLITSISEIKSGDAKNRKTQEEIYSCL